MKEKKKQYDDDDVEIGLTQSYDDKPSQRLHKNPDEEGVTVQEPGSLEVVQDEKSIGRTKEV